MEEGVDVGLIPDIEKYLPPEDLNRNNTSVNSPELKQALQKLVLELYKRRIVNKRQTRARVNLLVFLIAKPGDKYRFIWPERKTIIAVFGQDGFLIRVAEPFPGGRS